LRSAGQVDPVEIERGKYFRIVATVRAESWRPFGPNPGDRSVDGVDVAGALMENGLGRPFGRRKTGRVV